MIKTIIILAIMAFMFYTLGRLKTEIKILNVMIKIIDAIDVNEFSSDYCLGVIAATDEIFNSISSHIAERIIRKED